MGPADSQPGLPSRTAALREQKQTRSLISNSGPPKAARSSSFHAGIALFVSKAAYGGDTWPALDDAFTGVLVPRADAAT